MANLTTFQSTKDCAPKFLRGVFLLVASLLLKHPPPIGILILFIKV